MIKKTTWLLVLLINSLHIIGQDQALLTINDQKIFKSEFEQIYWKNKKEALATKLDLDEYIQLFINFKLKVLAAEKEGLDTTKKFINEFSSYKIQLEKPYLIDTSINEELMKEAYYRTINEVNASHIMVKLSQNSTPNDTLKAWKKINSIRSSVVNGENTFEDVAQEISDDPSAKTNKGNLGFFNAFKMVYSFEDAAYNTPVGEISKPIRTRFGYHIIKVNALRPAKGRVKTAHIMIATDLDNKEDIELGKKKIQQVYEQIEQNTFEELAQKFSDDRNSARKGGDLGWISSGGNYYKEFEDAIFSLKNDNEISKPFQTPNGWHIVKRIKYEPIGDYNKLKYELKNKIQKDARAQKTRSSFINKLKEEYKYRSYFKVNTVENIINDKSFNYEDVSKNNNINYIQSEILTFTDNKEKYIDFIDYLYKTKSLTKEKLNSESLSKLFTSYSNSCILKYERQQLEKKHPDFKALLKEYRDGILLFEISDQKIWSKAIKDTVGLSEFYEENKNNWMYPARRKVEIFTSNSEKNIKNVCKFKKKGKLKNDSIIKLVNSTNVDAVTSFKTNIINNTDEPVILIDNIQFGINKPQLIKGQWIMINVLEELEPRIKKLEEAEGLIVSAYQDYLEKQWLKNLHEKHQTNINYDVLYSIKNKP